MSDYQELDEPLISPPLEFETVTARVVEVDLYPPPVGLRARGFPLWDHGQGQAEIDRLTGRPLPWPDPETPEGEA